MSDIDQMLWDWLPGRQDRRRVTHPAVAAANLGISTAEALDAYERLRARGCIVRDSRGQGWHRGSPC